MDIKSALIEREDTPSLKLLSSSAILIKKKYAITTSNILSNVFQENLDLVNDIPSGKLHIYKGKKDFKLRAIWKDDNAENSYISKKANIFALCKCKNIEEFCKHKYKDWSIDFKENNSTVNQLVSIFIILAVENETVSEKDLKSVLHVWLDHIYPISFNKGDGIICKSTPFGTRDFLNSLTEGIISNTLDQSNLFLSDCSSTAGCEGGLVYAKKNCAWPVGIVISSLNWWRKDWAGFTLVAALQPIFCQIVGLDLILNSHIEINPLTKVLDTSEKSLAQINCGVEWGTCILLSKETGIFLTNSHVVRHGLSIKIIWKNKMMSASLIYKTPDYSIFDLAVVRCDGNLDLMSSCDTTVATYSCGDVVYCAGYPLISTRSKPEGITITRGIIGHSNPYMIKTTCGVFPGFSGGAVLNSEGTLLGIIVCNTRLADIDVTYPKFNMAVPYQAVSDVIAEYINKQEDIYILKKLVSTVPEAIKTWMRLEGKL